MHYIVIEWCVLFGIYFPVCNLGLISGEHVALSNDRNYVPTSPSTNQLSPQYTIMMSSSISEFAFQMGISLENVYIMMFLWIRTLIITRVPLSTGFENLSYGQARKKMSLQSILGSNLARSEKRVIVENGFNYMQKCPETIMISITANTGMSPV